MIPLLLRTVKAVTSESASMGKVRWTAWDPVAFLGQPLVDSSRIITERCGPVQPKPTVR